MRYCGADINVSVSQSSDGNFWMNDDPPLHDPPAPAAAERKPLSDKPLSDKPLSEAAERALAEAEARRAAAEANTASAAKEFQGPKGPEPTRFGDWERKGIASDF